MITGFSSNVNTTTLSSIMSANRFWGPSLRQKIGYLKMRVWDPSAPLVSLYSGGGPTLVWREPDQQNPVPTKAA